MAALFIFLLCQVICASINGHDVTASQVSSIDTPSDGSSVIAFNENLAKIGDNESEDDRVLKSKVIHAKKIQTQRQSANEQPNFPPIDEADKATPIELGAEETVHEDDELGSTFETDDNQQMNKIDGKRKPCQNSKNCASITAQGEDDDEDEDQPTPIEPDVPIELGSAVTEDDENEKSPENTNSDDTVTYLPFKTPKNFVIISHDVGENTPEENDDTHAQTSGDDSEMLEEDGSTSNDRPERSLSENNVQEVNATSISANTDGNYDGELLQTYQKSNNVETQGKLSRRRRRSLHKKQTLKKHSHVSNKPKKHKKHKQLVKKHTKWIDATKTSKRSDIEADKELLKTIENLNSMAASKRDIPGQKDKKPLKGYMKNLAKDVRSVLNKAKNALKDTGRVIHGLRRVISGADVLTSFTNNAVKFAKYYSLEPSNATVDYLEEKAIVSVLEAQRAASEAKEAAKLAKLAYSHTQAVEKKMEVSAHSHKKHKDTLKYVKLAGRQAARAEKAADLASRFKEKTEQDVMLMDQELRKMGTQLAEQNNSDTPVQKNITTSLAKSNEKIKSTKNHTKVKEMTPITENSFEDQQAAPDVQLLLPKMQKENEGKIGIEKSSESISTPVEDIREMTAQLDDSKQPSSYANYFQMKQKQLEKQLSNVTLGGTGAKSRKYALPGRKHQAVKNVLPGERAVKVVDMIPPAGGIISSTDTEVVKPDDQIELAYIASLNKKIAEIKKQEEEATQRLKAAELARTFVSTKTKVLDDLTPSKVSEENAIQRHLSPEASSVKEPSILKTNVPIATDQYASQRHHTTTTHESSSVTSNNGVYVKKQMIHKHNSKKPAVHLYPGEFTGFKKQEIPNQQSMISGKKMATAISESEIEDAVFDDSENSVVADDFDKKRKRENVAAEKDFFENVSDSESEENESGSGETGSSGEREKSEVSLLTGPVSVTLRVNSDKTAKRSNTFSKKEDFIDPFGFTRIANTNDNEIVDRTVIPRPDYLVANFKRSEVPRPIQQMIHTLTQSDVVNDGK